MEKTIKIIQNLLVKNARFNKNKAEYINGYKTAMTDVLVQILVKPTKK